MLHIELVDNVEWRNRLQNIEFASIFLLRELLHQNGVGELEISLFKIFILKTPSNIVGVETTLNVLNVLLVVQLLPGRGLLIAGVASHFTPLHKLLIQSLAVVRIRGALVERVRHVPRVSQTIAALRNCSEFELYKGSAQLVHE